MLSSHKFEKIITSPLLRIIIVIIGVPIIGTLSSRLLPSDFSNLSLNNITPYLHIIFVIIIVCGIIYVLSYCCQVSSSLVNRILGTNTEDIAILHKSKTIYIKNELFTHNICDVIVDMDIENHMNSPYPEYRFGIESNCEDGDSIHASERVPALSDIKATNECGGEYPIHDMKKYDPKFSVLISKSYENGIEMEKPKKVSCEFSIPIALEKNSSTSFQVSYPTKAFPLLLRGEKESTAVNILQQTDKLTIKIILDEKLKDKYTLADPEFHIKGKKVSYTVKDTSNFCMTNYMDKLKEKNRVPKFKKTIISWVIPHPMIGYTYCLYFTLKKNDLLISDDKPVAE